MTEISNFKTKFSSHEFKIGECTRTLQQVNNNLLIQGQNNASDGQTQGSIQSNQVLLNMHELDQEVKLIRGQILEERHKREQVIAEQNNLLN